MTFDPTPYLNPEVAVPFSIGFGTALVIGVLFRIMVGMRLNLYLLSHDSAVRDQSIIPITTENKKTSWLRILMDGNWREDVDLTLMDYHDRSFHFRFGYHLWNRFHMIGTGKLEGATIDGRVILPNRRYMLRTGAKLRLGDRKFTVLVTPVQMVSAFQKDWIPRPGDL